MTIRPITTGIAAALLGGVLLATPAHAAAPATDWDARAASCPAGYTTEKGTCAKPVATKPLTSAQKAQRTGKDQDRARWRSDLLARPTRLAARVPVRDYAMSEVATMTIFKEGQGDNKRSYTCGPASTRNMVAAMYKYKYGYYGNISENQFSIWEGTTTAGTARANIAAALNNHFSQFGSWRTWRPSDRFDLLATVATDTHDYHQSVILNVDTEYLSFFHGKALNHFDFAYGYDNTDSSKRLVYVGEEWDPIFIYGSSSYGNPYGKHKEQLYDVWMAISHTSIHGIVA